MQIFVKFSDCGVTCTVDIEPTTTVGEIKARAAAKLEATNGMSVAPAQIRLRWNSRQMDEGDDGRATAGSYGLTAASNVEAKIDAVPEGDAPDDGSAKALRDLRQDLEGLIAEEKKFVFIGIGSFDNNPEKGLTLQQQCPKVLPSLCVQFGLSLEIYLIDPRFGQRTNLPQIYDIGDVWTLDVFSDEEGGSGSDSEALDPTRLYSGPNDAQLSVYAVNLPAEEYDLAQLLPAEVPTKPVGRTLAGVDLIKVAAGIVKGGGVLVAGNFYSTDVAPFHVAGNKDILTHLGPPYYRP
jgi:hypothetical protein